MSIKKRVLTPFGFGWQTPAQQEICEVDLDKAHIGTKTICFGSPKEISAWGPRPHALVRTTKVHGQGIMASTMHIYPDYTGDSERALREPGPEGELRILLHLESCAVSTNLKKGQVMEKPYIIVEPWIDRLTKDKSRTYRDRETAMSAYDELATSVTGGIGASMLVDLREEEMKLLRFRLMIATPQEVIYDLDREEMAA